MLVLVAIINFIEVQRIYKERLLVSLKVADSKPDEVNEFFQLTQSFRPHQALGFTQPLT
jgi:hypothetical protein